MGQITAKGWVKLSANEQEEAKLLHGTEVETVIASISIIDQLAKRRAHHLYGGRHEDLAKAIGVSSDVYFKRLRVARIVHHYPRSLEYLRAGRVSVSTLSLLHTKITEANEEVVWSGILDKSRQEAQSFLHRVTDDGHVLPKNEVKTKVVLELTCEEAERLSRLVDVLSSGGKVATKEAAVVLALEETLERRDPMRRAQRYAERKAQSGADSSPKPETQTQAQAQTQAQQTGTREQKSVDEPTADAVGTARGQWTVAAAKPRPALPQSLRHEVYLRDGGVCRQRMPDGSICASTRMLEIDHRIPVSRGGSNTLENLELVCREHNTLRCHQLLGSEYAGQWRATSG